MTGKAFGRRLRFDPAAPNPGGFSALFQWIAQFALLPGSAQFQLEVYGLPVKAFRYGSTLQIVKC